MSKVSKVVISFTLDSERDRDLVRFLDGLGHRQRSEAIREVLRAGLARGGVTVGDVYQAVKELERKLTAGAFVAQVREAEAASDVPADVLSALNELGL